MAAITSSGTVIQVATIVQQLMSIEKVPANKLDSKINAAQTKITAYSTLKSKFSALESAAWAMSLKSSVDAAAFKATSSDETALKVAVSGASGSSSHSIVVNSLAQSHSIATKEFASSTAGLVTGDFDITVAGVTKTLNLNNASLTDVAAAINGAGVGAKASVMYGTSGYRLVVNSNTTGAANAVSMGLSATQSGTPSGEADFVFGGTGSMTQTIEAKDAQLVVDGVPVSRASNVITDVIEGTTLSLQKASASPISVGVQRDATGVEEKLKKMVDAYNDLASYIKSKAPTGTDSKGDLKGESSIVNMMASVRRALTTVYGPAGTQQLSSIGVKFERDGTLSLDKKALTTAVTERYDDVVTMLTAGVGGSGAMKGISDAVKGIIGSDGALGARSDGLSNSMRRMKLERTEMDLKLSSKENRLYAQYSRLDASLAKMQSSLSSLSSLFTQQS